MEEKIRWILGFYNKDTYSRYQFHDGFPEFEFWQPDFEAVETEGRRVIVELRERGDDSEWIAYAHPDPYAVKDGRHPGGQWLLSSRELFAS